MLVLVVLVSAVVVLVLDSVVVVLVLASAVVPVLVVLVLASVVVPLASAVVSVLVGPGGSTVVVGPGSVVVVASLVDVVPAEPSESVCADGPPQAGAAASASVKPRDERERCEVRMSRFLPRPSTLHRPIRRRNHPAGRTVGAPTDTHAGVAIGRALKGWLRAILRAGGVARGPSSRPGVASASWAWYRYVLEDMAKRTCRGGHVR
ncbi:hypothetical protein OV079_19500 [Nannocystis pusilla]|uniref:Uncharacterized protein n=1 Tax=Nannocystis pusilla TaxID=889268 RepID=A0A9X3EPZ4_9BACT|nr:hypothetical protein [Nannocystis pusilla]MCY1007696.1 hypothetical protein [Nannocystis pusilla]